MNIVSQNQGERKSMEIILRNWTLRSEHFTLTYTGRDFHLSVNDLEDDIVADDCDDIESLRNELDRLAQTARELTK